MAYSTEYLLRLVLEILEKCQTIEEARESIKNILADAM